MNHRVPQLLLQADYSRLPSATNHVLQAQSKGFTGPTLGPKKADENKRDFTEEQVKAGREGHIGLQAGGGTEKLASQSGQNFGLGRQIAGTGSGDSQYK